MSSGTKWLIYGAPEKAAALFPIAAVAVLVALVNTMPAVRASTLRALSSDGGRFCAAVLSVVSFAVAAIAGAVLVHDGTAFVLHPLVYGAALAVYFPWLFLVFIFPGWAFQHVPSAEDMPPPRSTLRQGTHPTPLSEQAIFEKYKG